MGRVQRRILALLYEVGSGGADYLVRACASDEREDTHRHTRHSLQSLVEQGLVQEVVTYELSAAGKYQAKDLPRRMVKRIREEQWLAKRLAGQTT